MPNAVATLQQRCGNVLIKSESNIVTTLETVDHVTTLRQRQQRLCDKVVKTSLCQLSNYGFFITYKFTKLHQSTVTVTLLLNKLP